MKRLEVFQTVRTVGGLFTSKLLQDLASSTVDEGLKPEDYHLSGLKINTATSKSWSILTAAWSKYREVREQLGPDDLGTGAARERWLLPLFSELGYGRLQPARGLEIDGKDYPISHYWGTCPIHLVGHGIGLDERTKGAAGAARQSPHSLVQEYLNRFPGSLWGFVSNGLVMRLLRDNASLTRQAYIEFDIEAMMEQEAYSDFGLLWLICHESRVTGERPELCWLEKWSQKSQQEGSRALQDLRVGVTEAIRILGEGFLTHPRNRTLHEKLASGELKPQEYYHQLLRTIYRILFLLVAEARGLLLVPSASEDAVDRYQRWYSISRLRVLAEKTRRSKHSDLWQGMRLLFGLLGSRTGCPELGIPALGSFLWSENAVPDLGKADLSNRYLLDAIAQISQVRVDKRISRVDFRNLGAEELGSVYEALLELHPDFTDGCGGFKLEVASGNARKTTGSYYTPTSLINELLDSALVPVMERAEKEGRKQGGNAGAEKALIDLKVCDPACGSGHFLIAAAHRIAKRLAAVRTGEDEPTPEPYRKALRDVISHCIYGVDLNSMAVELCKVSMWLEALEPGKPLSFLDHHLRVGNSLIGATPELIAQGIPDGAFSAITGDDKPTCIKLKKHNKQQRESGQLAIPLSSIRGSFINGLTVGIQILDTFSDDTIEHLERKEKLYSLLVESANYQELKLVADMWCSAFFLPKTTTSQVQVTTGMLLQAEKGARLLPEDIRQAVKISSENNFFFHWQIEFPEVFNPQREQEKGFSVVLGNPPWERIKLQEKEWFASRVPEIANARNKAEREKLIRDLIRNSPGLHAEFEQALREAEASSQFVRESGRFPLCGKGDVNTYTLFAELNRNLVSPIGRAGCVVPSGIATDDTTKEFFQNLTDTGSLISLFDFENRSGIFPDVDSRMKFCLLTMGGSDVKPEMGAEFVFFAHSTANLKDSEKRFTLSAEDIALLNPNTRTCPIFRSKKDAELTKAIYRRVPVLIKEARDGQLEENPWGIRFMTMFHMSNDSHLFRTREQLEAEGWKLKGNVFERPRASDGGGMERFLPLYEAKMIHHFDHRWATYDAAAKRAKRSSSPDMFSDEDALDTYSGPATRELTPEERTNPFFEPLPRYWVSEPEVSSKLEDRWPHRWLMGWRDITNSTNERTLIAGLMPMSGVGNKIPLMLMQTVDASSASYLLSCLDSLAVDYCTRQKIGGTTLNFYLYQQLPILPQSAFIDSCPWSPGQTIAEWIKLRVLELTYTTWAMKPFAEDLGFDGPPFSWDDERRFILRCELDAAFFHLYGCSRSDTDYILDTFPILRDKEIKKYGTYRTKDTILSLFNAFNQKMGSVDTLSVCHGS
ncbi:MAG: N-6 DNA methylase [Methanothrix sp.]|nr:N-6 DNA methylase [Methanothrix sp.]